MAEQERLDPEIRVYLKEIAARVAKGRTAEQVAMDQDLDPVFVQRLVSLPEFQVALEAVDPEAAKVWKDTRAEEFSQKRIRTLAREDGPVFYSTLKALALDGRLRDETRANVLEKLLKLGGFFKDDEAVETTHLAPTQIKTILEATKEMDEQD